MQAGFTLATCGGGLGPAEDRALFDEHLPKDMPFSAINWGVGFVSVDAGFANVQDRPKWAIPWMEDDSALTAPQLWVGRMRRDAKDALAYSCTGLIGFHWRTENIAPIVSVLAKAGWSQGCNSAIDQKHASGQNIEVRTSLKFFYGLY